MKMPKVFLTGGSGRLGTELRKELDNFSAPSSAELNISNYDDVLVYIKKHQPELIIHTAAYTNVSGAETDRTQCWQTNVLGTENLVKVANLLKIKLIHISTDYVFWGDKGMYKEEDIPGPTRNYYALTKLIAESVASLATEHLIIRTSFRPREWPYPTAFEDIYTSQDYVDIIAPDILLAIKHHEQIPFSMLHIATERKSVYELAKRRKPDVQKGSKQTANVSLPDDISLDISRWQSLKKGFCE